MPEFRWLPILMLLAGPGCAVTVRDQLPNDERPDSAQKKERFGELITGPGQRVSMSHTPAPPDGPIPTVPPRPLPVLAPNRPADVVAPPSPRATAPSRPDESRPGDAETLLPPIFRTGPGPDTPLLAAVRAYQDGRADFGQEQLRPFAVANQDVLAKVLPAAARVAVANLNDPKEATDILTKLESAADLLRARTELRVENLHICSRTIDFGEYEPIPPATPLRPGQYVKLYAEVKGAVPEVVVIEGEPWFSIVFRAQFRTRGNGKDWVLSKTYKREARNVPRDIIVITEFQAPTTAGTYSAELELTDTAGRRAKRAVDFRVDERK